MKNLKWANTIAFAAMVVVNALANLLPIGGNTTGQVSEAYPTLFTPAPIAFAIWGLIYLMMALFVVYQWEILDHGTYSTKVREDVGLWFIISCALNIAWIFLWHYRMIALSTIIILMLLATLVILQKRLNSAGESFLQRFAAKVGFSVYYGWIIAASMANIAVLLAQMGWNGWGLPTDFWTSVLLLIGAAVVSAIILIERNRIAGMAVMWAYVGILIRHISPIYFAAAYPVVIWMAFITESIMLTVILIPVMRTWFERKCRCTEQEERSNENIQGTVVGSCPDVQRMGCGGDQHDDRNDR